MTEGLAQSVVVTTIANLPAAARRDQLFLVTDALTYGDISTGGGTIKGLVVFNESETYQWLGRFETAGAGGSGTLNTIPLWTPDGTTLGNSIITQVSGDRIHVAGDMLRLSSVFPELRLHDTNSGNEFSIRSITQLRFGTETGTSGNAAFYVLAGIGANVIFNGAVGMGTASIAANIRLKLKSLASGSDVLRIESFNGVEIAAIHDDSDNAMLDLQDSGGTQRIRLHAGTDEGNYIDNPLTVGSNLAPEASLFVVEETSAAASDRLIRCQSSEGNHIFDVRAFSDGRGLIEMRNTAGQQVQIYTDGDSYFKGGNFGIGTSSILRPFHVKRTNTSVLGLALFEQAGAGDAQIGFLIAGGASLLNMGLDNSDGDNFKISYDFSSGDVGVDTLFTIDKASGGTFFRRKLTTITSDTTIDSTYSAINIDASGGDVTLSLDASPFDGQTHEIRRSDTGANSVTVDGNGKDIDKESNIDLGSFPSAMRIIFGSTDDEWGIF